MCEMGRPWVAVDYGGGLQVDRSLSFGSPPPTSAPTENGVGRAGGWSKQAGGRSAWSSWSRSQGPARRSPTS